MGEIRIFKPSKKFIYFTIRLILVYVLSYIFVGVVFSNFENYAGVFIKINKLADYRTQESLILKLAPLLQIIKAFFFALILYPFYGKIIKSNLAWLKLFFLIWGFSLVGSAAAIPGSIEGFIYTDLSLLEHLVKIPEATIQIFVFSWFFVKWEDRTERDYSSGGN